MITRITAIQRIQAIDLKYRDQARKNSLKRKSSGAFKEVLAETDSKKKIVKR
ncbi:hypothetical protein P22_3712 [Propionispora sp. 2/2-37]|uniref:hypothetical protein n=1 Tax=Propionispora sp. 2/2-37 TaxID=1677858 RepID=UPI0006C5D81A|nr:hypothetical protein [Propionispora sp. 2/2-37]CUH97581.1 hypothetical protein P22_3712 [Propionispora sp. 2/2-37]